MLAQSRYGLNLPYLQVIGQMRESNAVQYSCSNFEQIGSINNPLIVDALSSTIFLAEQ